MASSVHQTKAMYDVDAIEAINFEQLVTVTDRLLLRGRLPKRRPSTNRITPWLPDAVERTVVTRAPQAIKPTTVVFGSALLALLLLLAALA